MQNTNKQDHTFDIKSIWHDPNFLRYSGLAIFILGISLCLLGVIQSSLLGINLGSPREEISKVVTIIGIGIPLIFVGMNMTLKLARRYAYLIAFGMTLSLVAVAVFHTHYVKNWYYPLAGFVCLLYILGILSLIGVIFTNTTKKEIEINGLKGELTDLSERLKLKAEKKSDDEFLALKGKLNLYGTKIRELQDDLQKLQIDFEDYGWGIMEEREKTEKLLLKLLTITDDCEPFLEYEVKSVGSDSNAVERIRVIYHRLQNILKAEGVRTIAPEIGENFDPHRHEIVNRNDNLSEDVVVKEVSRKGYVRNSAILRKASVIVENKYEKR